MFKRASKVTALLVAAASVMSMVPAMAADTMRLGNKDGHVYEGVSFKDGKYGYYGYRTDDDNTGIYYNSGSKDKDVMVKDAEDYSITRDTTGPGVKFGDKYLIAAEGGNGDEYLIDLTTGKIADIDTPEDQEATAKARLISAMKKAERYNGTSDDGYGIDPSDVNTRRMFKNQFGDVWYQFATTSSAVTLTANGAKVNDSLAKKADGTLMDSYKVSLGKDVSTTAAAFVGFTDGDGKYVDASKLAKIKVYDAKKEKTVLIDNFGTDYKDEAMRVNLKSLKPLAQDKDFIYALARVDVVYYNDTATDYSKVASVQQVRQQAFIQKIAKARGSQTDGAWLPKSVESWQIDTNKSDVLALGTGIDTTYDANDDMDDAAEVLLTGNNHVSVINGVLYVTKINTDGDNAEVTKLKLKNEKLDLEYTLNAAGKKYSTVNSKMDAAVVEKDERDDNDFTTDGKNGVGLAYDVNGNTWVLKDGEVKMFDGTEFKTKYKTDRSLNRLDVYDSNNLMAWDDDNDGVYTTVTEGKQQTVSDGQVVDPNLVDKTTVKTGWVQEGSAWTFYDATGAKVAGNWVNDKGAWYFLKADGTMATGWTQVAGTWYFLNGSGAMQTGWVNDGGTWYFLKSSGAMATGWLNDSGTWYFLQSSGAMASNTVVDGYTLNGSGAWVQ